jgi:hypothetical protein
MKGANAPGTTDIMRPYIDDAEILRCGSMAWVEG